MRRGRSSGSTGAAKPRGRGHRRRRDPRTGGLRVTVTRARLSTRAVTARASYAVLFSAALPAALILWARRLDTLLRLPAYGTPIQGTPIAAAGVALVTAA